MQLAGAGLFGAILGLALAVSPAHACQTMVSVCAHPVPGAFALIENGRPTNVVVDSTADPAVRRVANAFAEDAARVAGTVAVRPTHALPASGQIVLIGVLGRSPLIDRLVADRRIRVGDLKGRWEAFQQTVVEHPFPGISTALVIVGADRRGAVFGAYDLSEKIGVSPWAWWADVPVRRQADLYITAGRRTDAPKVKYRGIFINDEEPSFGSWARKKFGGINARLYEHVFDLTLRLKANYLWPAMWGKGIGIDDPKSMPLADAMGVILGTSHHEPMTRAQVEWHRGGQGSVTGGKWDYLQNAANLRAFWRGGIERMMSKGDGVGFEQLVTIGMRGDGDEPMGEGTAIGLLERIVADQRAIIADVTKRPPERTPQVWALYKEVQDYYDAGMKVPDDVTLLFADDNWGQIRRLPTRDLGRSGGFGVYYHFDYVGGPRSYKWLNTVQIEKVWQQMDLAYRRGVKSMWIVNVGDLKPMEFPIDFFLKMAWNPEAMTAEAMTAFPRQWASAAFGPAHAGEIGDLMSDYSRLAARRKPELVDADSFALGPVTPEALDGGEFGRMVAEWDALDRRMELVRKGLSAGQYGAYFQLVEFPVAAMANLYRLYYSVAWNRRLASANDARANWFADQAEAAFRRDGELRKAYHGLNDEKWDGMMLQTHIGYTSWNDPKVDVMPQVVRVKSAGAAPAPIFRSEAALNDNAAVAEAGSFVRALGGKGLAWKALSRLGGAEGAVGTFPQGRPATTVADNVRAEYRMTLPHGGDATLRLYLVPALDTSGGGGLRVGVSVDDGPVQTLVMNLKVDGKEWSQAVRDNVAVLEASFPKLDAGPHMIKLWRIDDNVLVQRLVLYTGRLTSRY